MQSLESKDGSIQRYVDILSNGGFKALFGDAGNKDVVMSIINVFLPDHRRVVDISYLPTEHHGPVMDLSKDFQFDFMCTDASGTVFIVEMQRYHEDYWFKRCVSYASRAYDRQNRTGFAYDVPPVYLIGLMGVDIAHPDEDYWRNRYVSEYTFREKNCHDLLDETIFIIFAELTRFHKSEDECETLQDMLLYLLKNSGRMTRPPRWAGEKQCREILNAMEIKDFSKDKRKQYDKDMYDEKRRNGELAAAREDGMAQAQHEIVRKLKSLGVAIETIVEATGLDRETVEAM